MESVMGSVMGSVIQLIPESLMPLGVRLGGPPVRSSASNELITDLTTDRITYLITYLPYRRTTLRSSAGVNRIRRRACQVKPSQVQVKPSQVQVKSSPSQVKSSPSQVISSQVISFPLFVWREGWREEDAAQGLVGWSDGLGVGARVGFRV